MSTTNQTSKYIKPLIKWVGGKTQIIQQIIDTFPNDINNYHELFLGGGSVLLALLEDIKNNKIDIKGNIYAYDLNETLINMYKNIQRIDDNLQFIFENSYYLFYFSICSFFSSSENFLESDK